MRNGWQHLGEDVASVAPSKGVSDISGIELGSALGGHHQVCRGHHASRAPCLKSTLGLHDSQQPVAGIGKLALCTETHGAPFGVSNAVYGGDAAGLQYRNCWD